MTSPLTVRWKSVTSSGRSSTSTTIRWTSGLFVAIALAIACMIIVLPALGGETIRPRWPLPIGETRSMIRRVSWFGVVSSLSRSCGYSGVSLREVGPVLGRSGSPPLMVSTLTSGLNFSLRSPSLDCADRRR